jgi:cytochrome c oxidase subunit I+III
VNFFVSWRRNIRAPDDPWHGDSLEWAVSSPPPEYNFATVPYVTSRHPVWDQDPPPPSATSDAELSETLSVTGALERELPVSEGIDAHPQDVAHVPRPTYLPFIAAVGLAVFFVGLLVQTALVGILGVLAIAVGATRWIWRTEADLR